MQTQRLLTDNQLGQFPDVAGSVDDINFLNRNQYGIWFSDRCNYKCSYCCNTASPKAPKSDVESNTQAIIDLLDQVEPGVILVTGGEPTLWQDLPHLLEALPQHYWGILTNLTAVPAWLSHPNIKIILPAFHEEFANRERFTNHLMQLQEMGKRMHVKLIVKPQREYEQIDLWEQWNSLGVPTSLVPLEYTHLFKREFLEDVISKFRTSSLYNSRFFKSPRPITKPCIAGTEKFFQINSNGQLVRCSSVFEGLGETGRGSIWQPEFNQEAKSCSTDSCYCEWHHWARLTNAHDNRTWNHYLETGEWKIPTVEELCQFVVDMDWDVAGRNAEGSKESLFDFSNLPHSLQIKAQLKQSELQVHHFQSQAESAKQALQKLQEESQLQLQQVQDQFQQAQSDLEKARITLEVYRNRIKAMESSKFWGLRSRWIWLKQQLGFKPV